MPVSVDSEIRRMSQDEFAEVSYVVMREAFAIHRHLGRLFDEVVYRKALLTRVADLQDEVRIDVSHKDFQKSYYIDILAANGAVFELKTVDRLNFRHRGQLLNYLLLAGLDHGKLINFRNSQVEHEFVNSSASTRDRMCFSVDETEWQPTKGFGRAELLLVQEVVRDWGTGLSRSLYDNVLMHFLCGAEDACSQINVYINDLVVAMQNVALCSENVVLRVTALDRGIKVYCNELMHLVNRTDVMAVQWINIASNQLVFKTVK